MSQIQTIFFILSLAYLAHSNPIAPNESNQLAIIKTVLLPQLLVNSQVDSWFNQLTGVKISRINETLNNDLVKDLLTNYNNNTLINKESVEKVLGNQIKQKGNDFLNQKLPLLNKVNQTELDLAYKIYQNKTLMANVLVDLLETKKNESNKQPVKSKQDSDAEFERMFMSKKDKQRVAQNIEKEVGYIFKTLYNIAQRDISFDKSEFIRQVENNDFNPAKVILGQRGSVGNTYDKIKLGLILDNSLLASAAKGFQRGVSEVTNDLQKDVNEVAKKYVANA